LDGNKRRVVLKPKTSRWVAPSGSSCVTSYPDELIEAIARTKAFGDICDEILREESDWYVEKNLTYALLSYVAPEWFDGKVVLDFGCGMGSSTMILARKFPRTQIHGAELEPSLLAIARLRQRHYRATNVLLFQSPSGDRLPEEVGQVDAIVMSALFEHLLPAERRALLPMLWDRLRPGGILFVTETPHRFWVIEGHTTRLPLLNYLPDSMALWATRRFSRRYPPDVKWDFLLREGIRGGTVAEIRALLRGGRQLEPTRLVRDRIDLWYAISCASRPSPLKRVLRSGLRAIRKATGLTITPGVDVAFLKPS
jgi:SAM-dependent methyltransferase